MSGKMQVSQLQIIGATAAPEADELPARMDPICVSREDPAVVYLIKPGSGMEYIAEDRERFDEECEQGHWQVIDPPIPLKNGYQLVQIREDLGPEYLPATALPDWLRGLGEDALRQAEDSMASGHWGDQDIEKLWFAVRAMQGDPLPLVILIAFERPRFPEESIDHLERQLQEGEDSLFRAFKVLQTRGDLPSLWKVVAGDPLAKAYLDHDMTKKQPYLWPYREKKEFLAVMNSCWGSSSQPLQVAF
jgi:hypothetical protein